jgi:hypothetical protein
VFSFDAASGELKAKGGPVKTTCGKPVSLVFAPKLGSEKWEGSEK